ncbi:hypothetical protein EJB05_57259, partial [Eragrostis curvula]
MKWMAVAKLLTALCLGDWKRIMEEGPWIFRGCALMVEEFDGATAVPTVMPNKVPAWVQLHLIPPLYRTEGILKMIAGRIGEEIMIEMRAIPTEEGDFFRVRVNLPADRPLVRFVKLTPEGRDTVVIQIKYEKLPRFCFHCGLMGHNHLECGTGEYTEDDLQFGGWMVADEETWRRGTPRFRGAPASEGPRTDQSERGAARGRGGRGRGGRPQAGGMWRRKPRSDDNTMSRKRHSQEAGLDEAAEEVADTASSPLKPVDEEARKEDTPTAKKKLVLSEGEGELNVTGVPPPPPQYISPRERKKAKASTTASPSKKKAGSVEEVRQAP